MITAFALAIDQIVYGRVLAGIAAAIVSLQAAVIAMAARRRRPGRTLLSLRVHMIAGAAIAALPIATVVSVHAARVLMLAAYSSDAHPSERAEMMAQGISGQINAIPFGVSTTLLAVALWVVGAALTLSVRRSDGRARSFPPAALVLVGVVPIAFGALQWSVGIIKGFAASAGIRPEEKAELIDVLLSKGRTSLTASLATSMMAVAVSALIAVVLIVQRAAREDGAGATPRARSARLPLAVSAAALVVAAVLVAQARPIAAENATPWPPTIGTQFVYGDGPTTPALVGPDPPERAPVVSVFRDHVALDGFTVPDLTDLEMKLGTLRNNWKLLNPSGDFNDMAIIEADAAVPIARLVAVLSAVRGAWYYRPLLAFTAKETHVRPVLGTLHRGVVTGARVRVAYSNDEPDEYDDDDVALWKTAVAVRAEGFASYDALARRIVELRRAGKPVLLEFDRPAAN